MLKRKKPQNGSPPSSSPPLEEYHNNSQHNSNTKSTDKSSSSSNRHKKDRKKSGNGGSASKDHDNIHSKSSSSQLPSSSSIISNPKKYQKSNFSSNNSNDLIDHHRTISPPSSSLASSLPNNSVGGDGSSNNPLVIDSESNSEQIYDVEQLTLIKSSPTIDNKLPIKEISLDSPPIISPKPVISNNTPTKLQESLKENLDYIPINSNEPLPQISNINANNNNNNHLENNNSNNSNSNSNNNNKYIKKSNNKQNFDNSKEPYKHIPIWLEGICNGKDLADLTLTKEIEHFVGWINPNQYETRLRQKIVKEVESVIRFLWPSARVFVFGSFLTNLSLPSSDIDIQVSHNNVHSNNSFSYDPIRDLHSLLIRNHQDSFTNCRLISGAKVPIIKMISKNTYYNIDICFNTPGGIENTVIVKALLDRYKSMRTLLLVIKFFLFQNSLNETYTGGIGSYALALMVVSFIQLRYVPMNLRTHFQSSKSRKNYKDAGDDTDYGAMLVEFFELYGRSFNYSLYGISLENGGFYFIKEEQWGTSLTLLDPHDRDNDVGKNSFNIPFIRGAFTNSLLKIISNEVLKDRYSKISFPTILSKIIEERLVEQMSKERNSAIKYGKLLEESNQLAPLLDDINDLCDNPPLPQQQKSVISSKKSSTYISISSSDESSKDYIDVDDDSSSTTSSHNNNDSSDNSSQSDGTNEVEDNSDDVNSIPYSDEYSSSSDSEIESGANSSSPNQSNASPLSSDNEDGDNNKNIQTNINNNQNLSTKSDPYGW